MNTGPRPSDAPALRKNRLQPATLLLTAWSSVSSRRIRTALASLGIALGIAALIAVTGIAASNRAHLLHELDRLGANLLTVEPGQQADPSTDTGRRPVSLPATAPSTASDRWTRSP
jgi:putative ABC transport system permease protein